MFLDYAEKIAKISKAIIRQKKVKIFSQFDCDGLCSASILTKAMLRENVNFELRIYKQLTEKLLNEIQASENDFLIFADFGSGQLQMMQNILDKTQVLILDHHEPVNFNHMNLLHVNPMMHNEDEMSASIVCYSFAKFLNPRNTDLVDIALIGAIGDESGEKWEFKGFIKKILEEAEVLGKVSVHKGLRFYGRSTRPIHKSLALTYEPFIPGVSGSESQAIQFLSDIGIRTKQDGDWIKLKDLTKEEEQKLASAIIVERMKTETAAEDIFGDIYTLIGKPEELQDAREFATLVNACGRTQMPQIAIRLLLGDYSAIENSHQTIEDYRRMISDALNWLRENPESIKQTPLANFIIANGKIPESIIGTIASIVVNSDFVDSAQPLFALANSDEDKMKISARLPKNLKINLRGVMTKIISKTGGEAGGHANAAGGFIPKAKVEEFINTTQMVLGEMIVGKES